MMKSAFALLLIAGILSLAHVGAAFGGETTGSRALDGAWRDDHLSAYLASRGLQEVPWLEQVSKAKAQKKDWPLGRQADVIEPLRLPLLGSPNQVMAGAAFNAQ